MSLVAFLSFVYYGIIWRLVLVLLKRPGRIKQWLYSSMGFYLGSLFITASILLLIIICFSCLNTLDLFLIDHLFLHIYPFLLDFQNIEIHDVKVFHTDPLGLMSYISCKVMSSFPFLIFMICFCLSFDWGLVSLIYLFNKSTLFHWLSYSLISISSIFIFIISFYLIEFILFSIHLLNW